MKLSQHTVPAARQVGIPRMVAEKSSHELMWHSRTSCSRTPMLFRTRATAFGAASFCKAFGTVSQFPALSCSIADFSKNSTAAIAGREVHSPRVAIQNHAPRPFHNVQSRRVALVRNTIAIGSPSIVIVTFFLYLHYVPVHVTGSRRCCPSLQCHMNVSLGGAL